jgi:hypothetical protein
MTAEQVLAELAAVYGTRFERAYSGADPETMRRGWERQLAALPPKAIEWALVHLPSDHVPNAMEFRALALQRPSAALPMPAPTPTVKASPQRVAAALSWRPEPTHPRQWARTLADREAAGEQLTQAQRTMWRVAHHHGDGGSEQKSPGESTT